MKPSPRQCWTAQARDAAPIGSRAHGRLPPARARSRPASEVGRDDDLERVGGERLAVHVPGERRRAAGVLLAHDQVEVAAQQGRDRHLGLGLDQLHPQAGMAPLAVQQRRHQRAGGTAERGDPAGAGRLPLVGVQLGLGQLEGGEDLDAALGQSPAGVGEPHPAPDPLEQRYAGLALQQGELVGDSGRAHVQRLGHRRDGPAAAQLDQQAEPSDVQHASIIGIPQRGCRVGGSDRRCCHGSVVPRVETRRCPCRPQSRSC